MIHTHSQKTSNNTEEYTDPYRQLLSNNTKEYTDPYALASSLETAPVINFLGIFLDVLHIQTHTHILLLNKWHYSMVLFCTLLNLIIYLGDPSIVST